LDETGRRYLDRIENSAARMCVLVEDLLRFSRITRVEMSEGKVDLTEIVRGLAAELAAQDSGREVEFVVADGVEGWGDPALLRTALLNLMENAWKYTRKRAAARIEFGTLEGAQSPVYFVRDNGAGFNMAEADRLFNPFQRLHKESDFEGTGIGLATVDRIIRRHGGQVWAQGEVGQGATFFFTLGREASR
jgi:signal transduction histidine kinase